MARLFLGYGRGTLGTVQVSADETETRVDSSCSGTSGTKSLTATNPSFASGDFIFIWQVRGTGATLAELNRIDSYVAGTITTVYPLENDYTDDAGNSQAQVVVVKEASNLIIDAGKTFTVKQWNQDVGGVSVFMVSGKTTINGTWSGIGNDASGATGGVGTGFKGGDGVQGAEGTIGYSGEGTEGVSTQQLGHVGNGGGSAKTAGTVGYGYTGGSGGNATAGTSDARCESENPGTVQRGDEAGNAELTLVAMGGGAGASAGDISKGVGRGSGAGGGVIILYTKELKIESAGYITVKGGKGATSLEEAEPNNLCPAGSGGAGGSILIKAVTADIGTNRIIVAGGDGGDGGPIWGIAGYAGAAGRLRIDACKVIGTANGISKQEGGHSWCGGAAEII